MMATSVPLVSTWAFPIWKGDDLVVKIGVASRPRRM